MEPADLPIEPLEAHAAPDDHLVALHDLDCSFWYGELLPADPRPPAEEAIARFRRPSQFFEERRFVAWAPDRSHVVGEAVAGLSRERDENRHLGSVWVHVRPEARRSGLGRRLLSHAVDAAAADGRTSLHTWGPADGPGEGFLGSLGAPGWSRRILERLSRLQIADLDPDLLHDWVTRAKERADGYSLVEWRGPVPPEWRERFARACGVMNTAPREGLEYDDEVPTPEEVDDSDARLAAARIERWVVAAVDGATQEIAGFTELFVKGWRPWEVDQGGTGVFPAHRDRGLGRWLKATMLLKLVAERPAVRWVDTGNAGSNRPMLAINDALGFRPILWTGGWQGPTEALRDALGVSGG